MLGEEKKRYHKIRQQMKQETEAAGTVQEKETHSGDLQPLSLLHLQGTLFVLVTGLLVGVLVFLAERLLPSAGSAGGGAPGKPSSSSP